MSAIDLFQAGKLREAIDAQVVTVKAQPTDQAARFLLFEFLLFAGDLDRARKQLDVLHYDDPARTAAVDQYRFALDTEAKRRRVFSGHEQPKVLATTPHHLRQRLEALACNARGEFAEARQLLDEANAAVPSLTGTLDGKSFDGLYDADERLGTVLEVFATGGVYSWLPLEQVRSLVMNPPLAPRDIILRPASVTMTDGTTGDVLIPGLYPDSHAHPDDEIKLARGTVWLESDGGLTRGSGGRLLLAGSECIALSNVNNILIDTRS